MTRWFFLPFMLLIIRFGASGQSCPATNETMRSAAFTPPAPYKSLDNGFLFGTPSLWTYIPDGPLHTATGRNLSAKLVFWRVEFDWKSRPGPDLKVVARRLDAPAPLIEGNEAHGVLLQGDEKPENMAMMTGITFHEPGCYQIIANYKGYALGYIVEVVP